DYHKVECICTPGPGVCANMATANTMACVVEALGMSLPGQSLHRAVDDNNEVTQQKLDDCAAAAAAVLELLQREIRTRDILTRKAFENAITVLMAVAGSTNAVIHLIAVAFEAEVELRLDDFQEISNRVPVLTNLKPEGAHGALALDAIGGLPVVMKVLLDGGLLHGDALTVTGRTVAENLSDVVFPPDQDVVFPLAQPYAPAGRHLTVLEGNFAPGGSMLKTSGKDIGTWRGPARVFDTQQEIKDALQKGLVKKGEAVVARYLGPRGAPGMPEVVIPHVYLGSLGLALHCPFITDGRFSGTNHGLCIAHVVPEAAAGGNIALVRDGDMIRIEHKARQLVLEVDEEEMARRRAAWQPRQPVYSGGHMAKYAACVQDASHGCVTYQRT
ncbi:hypothetical protein CYMTET_49800, partial [Cymbomonas tetramitiformis]